MKILLSFYPDFKITQLSETTARMWLSNEYDLFIDTNSNPGSWTAQRKRGTLRNDMMLRGGRVPTEDVEKADALIKRYQEALVTHIMEVEGREKDGIKKDIEVLKWHKKPRGQAPAPPLTSHHREPCVIIPVEEPGQEEEESHFPTAEEFGKGLMDTILTAQNGALPEEPNLDEIQEAPGEEVQDLDPGYYALPYHPLDPNLKNLVGSGDRLEVETELKNTITYKIEQNLEAAKLQPGENYSEKIEAKYKEIFEALTIETIRAQNPNPQPINPGLDERLSAIYENLEVLRLLHDCQKRQNLQSQEPVEEKQAQEAAQLNEVFLLKNSKGYSWKITARGMDLEKTAEAVLMVNESFKAVAKGGADTESKTFRAGCL